MSTRLLSRRVIRRGAVSGRAVRWGIVTGVVVWALLSLVGGTVQYAPQGWNVPVAEWRFYDDAYTYWFYPWSPRWALVLVPAFFAKALPVAALAGGYVGLTVARRATASCCTPRRGGASLAGVGVLAGFSGMLACCSPLALVVVGLVGSTALAAMMAHGLWLGAAVLAVAVGWQGWALVRGRRQVPGGAGEQGSAYHLQAGIHHTRKERSG
jgi:hypothetical protein